MALDVWTKPSGYNLGNTPGTGSQVTAEYLIPGIEYVIISTGTTDFTKVGATANIIGYTFTATGPTTGTGIVSKIAIDERSRINIPLPTALNVTALYSVISGKLPDGLRINNNAIVGTPYEVPRLTEFSFCIRAKVNNQISDRTFRLSVDGADPPQFLTPAGDLAIGPNEQYFVMDNSYVEYQIDAFDFDTAVGQRLGYFIADDEGELPPGLMLSDDGRIIGLVQPVETIKPEDGNGFYDTGAYDSVGYDWGYRPSNGYDSFFYDTVIFDYSVSQRGPRKLNRNYEFIISVTDGDTVAKRKFKIFVVSDDYFRADNTLWLNGTGLFTADVSYLRVPIWVTSKYLGTYRANNYVTLIIDTYDTKNVIYNLEAVNAEITATTYQITDNDNVINSVFLTIVSPSSRPVVGQYLSFQRLINGGTEKLYQIIAVDDAIENNLCRLTLSIPLEVTVPNDIRFFIGSKSILPPGMNFDLNSAEVFGVVPYQPAITTTYNFTITATRVDFKTETAASSRIFTIDIIGEIDSILTWITDPDLGRINANFISTLHVHATSTITNAIVLYQVVSGTLPPGLKLDLDGEIIGKVDQYGDLENNITGLTTIDLSNSTSFDNGATSFDRKFTFTVEAFDQYRLAISTRQFTIIVDTPNQIVYSNLRVQPFLKLDQRSLWKDFINDTAIFTSSSIYRPNDPNFGVQTNLSMIIYAGIETSEAAAYIGAIGLNHKRKRFHFGSVKKAIAVKPGTNTQVYEVIYIEMIDPSEANGSKLSNKILLANGQPQPITIDNSTALWRTSSTPAPELPRPEPMITVDSSGYTISDPNFKTYFPNGVSNWRSRIKSVGATERNYLPLWMRSIQPGTKEEIDFKLAVPLCYCKVGAADDIILNIKYSGFDFKLLDYTADRYIIDAVEGSVADKYLVFRNDRITV